MKRKVITQRVLDEYAEKWKNRERYKPTWLYCSLCSNLRHRKAKGFRVGEIVYRVTYQDAS